MHENAVLKPFGLKLDDNDLVKGKFVPSRIEKKDTQLSPEPREPVTGNSK